MTPPETSLSDLKTWTLSKADSATLSVDCILHLTVTDFALFVLVNEEFILFAPANYQWTKGELSRILKEGHSVVYYHIIDQHKVDAYHKVSSLGSIDTSTTPHKRILQVTEIAADLTRILYDYPLTPTSLAKGSEIATHLVDVMQEDNTCVVALGKLASHDWYTYYHSARVAAYALAIAIEMGVTDGEQLHELSLGCLFHDVGKSRIELSILNKSGPLSNDEWAKIRSHPELGIMIVDATKFGQVPREIILHHHERLDGGGYPHKLSKLELLQEVRISSFADTFDALTTNRPYQPGRSRFEAMDLIRQRFLQQLDPECYKAMVSLLRRASGT